MKFLQVGPKELTICHNLIKGRDVLELLRYYSNLRNRPIPVMEGVNEFGQRALYCLDANFECFASRIFEDESINVVVLQSIEDFRKLTEVCVWHFCLDAKVIAHLLAEGILTSAEAESLRTNNRINEAIFYETIAAGDSIDNNLRRHLERYVSSEKIEQIIEVSEKNKEKNLYESFDLGIADEGPVSLGRQFCEKGIRPEDVAPDISNCEGRYFFYQTQVITQTQSALRELQLDILDLRQNPSLVYTGLSDQTRTLLEAPSPPDEIIYPAMENLWMSIMYKKGYDRALQEILSL